MITIKATFIGNYSLGYETGKRYTLVIYDTHGMSIYRLNGEGHCPYESLSAFLKNWDDIIRIH